VREPKPTHRLDSKIGSYSRRGEDGGGYGDEEKV